MKKLLLPLLFLALLLQSCVNDAVNHESQRPEQLPRALTASEDSLISLGNTFSYNIFQHVVAADKEKNVFISPLSISMALGMTLNGAEGTTKEGIQKALGMHEMKLQAINKSYKSLIKLLVNLDPRVEIDIANSLWSRKGFAINPSFKDTLQTYFDARTEELDFDKPSASQTINDWVSDQTNGRIKRIIEGNIPDEMMLYLINAVYFKGRWLTQFNKDDTAPADFHLQDGSTVRVDMMHQHNPIPTFRSDEVNMAQLAYGDSLYNMTILMPANPDIPIDDFVQQSFTSRNLVRWTNQLRTGDVPFMLPKFEVSYSKKLNDILSAMGMSKAFSDLADFSKINSNVHLQISKVQHKADITVDEEGSEAAAVTSVGVAVTSSPAAFRVNRPFVYLIRERISGTVLFMGVMRHPHDS